MGRGRVTAAVTAGPPGTARGLPARAAHLHHGHVLLGRGGLDLAGHLDDGLHQARHVLVHPVVGAVQVGSGRGADLLGLKLPTQKLVTALLCRGRRHRTGPESASEETEPTTQPTRLLGAQFTWRMTVNWFE